jgi:hypothetical protein
VYEPDTLAAALDVDLNVGVCFACLSFVSLAIDHGDAAEIAREVRRMSRICGRMASTSRFAPP